MYPILRDYQVLYNKFDFGYSNFHASYRSIFVNSLAIVANEATSCTSSAPQRNKQIKEKKWLENQFNVAMDALDLWKKKTRHFFGYSKTDRFLVSTLIRPYAIQEHDDRIWLFAN